MTYRFRWRTKDAAHVFDGGFVYIAPGQAVMGLG